MCVWTLISVYLSVCELDLLRCQDLLHYVSSRVWRANFLQVDMDPQLVRRASAKGLLRRLPKADPVRRGAEINNLLRRRRSRTGRLNGLSRSLTGQAESGCPAGAHSVACDRAGSTALSHER